jgi:fermentation-respiration switch protein FrsA (DUF1100 family)
MTSMRRIMIGVLAGIATLYAAGALITRMSYRRMLYPAPAEGAFVTPAGAELVTTKAADGTTVHALLWPARAATEATDPTSARGDRTRTVVHFHGNGETIGANVDVAAALAERGVGVMLVEYRGYGLSVGAPPSEAGLYLDAEAALDALAARGVLARDITLWGTSLGTGVAVEMARRARGTALVLMTPYTSIPAMAARFVPFFPTRLLVDDAFDNLAKASALQLPTLVVHGDRDELIPFAMGEAVAGAIPGARLWRVERGRHNDLFARAGEPLIDAIAKMAPSR